MSFSDSSFMTGFWIGNLAYLGVLALIFWFVGRWGWFGLLIRIACGALFLWRAVQILAFMSGSG
jgi:hypothetical protein